MPEFHLDQDGRVDGKTFADLDPFTQGYIEACFFTECSAIAMSEWDTPASQEQLSEGTADGSIPADAGFGDLHPDTLAVFIADCQKFQTEQAALLALAYDRPDYDEQAAGRDFWYTRHGHGVGFWDRQQLDADELGDKLSEACGRQESNLWFGAGADSPTGYGFVFVE